MTKPITENFELILEGDENALKQIMTLFQSGELQNILGVPILGIDTSIQATALTTNWFKKIEVSDWLYDIGIQASRLVKQLMLSNNMVVATLGGLKRDLVIEKNQLDNIVSQLSPKWLSDIGLDSSKNTSEHILISLLNSGNLDWMKFIAYQIGELTTVPTTIIDTLASCITTIQDSETRWQLALTLAQLDPEHPLGAVGQTKTIEFSNDHWLDLFLALRVGEDDLIDVLVEVTSATDEYLPVGLQVSLLDETEEVFLEVLAEEEARYLSLEFTGAISQFFSIKFSLEDNDLIDNFVI